MLDASVQDAISDNDNDNEKENPNPIKHNNQGIQNYNIFFYDYINNSFVQENFYFILFPL